MFAFGSALRASQAVWRGFSTVPRACFSLPRTRAITPLPTLSHFCRYDTTTTASALRRNVAIIAHVDHGKTSLVDKLLQASDEQISGDSERLMDHNDLERERGITILAKCTSMTWTRSPGMQAKINLLDTPGHGDFGGEVERILNMVDGVVLVVDASHGPGVQTKFVLSKALKKKLIPLVVLNKMDRSSRQVAATEGKVFDLFCQMGADERQMEYRTIYASAREGWANTLPERGADGMRPLLEAIVDSLPSPQMDNDRTNFTMLVSLLEYDDHMGRIVVGIVRSGRLSIGDSIVAVDRNGDVIEEGKVFKITTRRGLTRFFVDEAMAGDIVGVAGLSRASVSDTVCSVPKDKETSKDVKSYAISIPSDPMDPPVLSMTLRVNDSPLAGQEGQKCTSRVIEDRLKKELETNVSLKVKKASESAFEVFARGELQLAILLETMRREGFEMSVTQPMVVMKRLENGELVEPVEEVIIECDELQIGPIIDQMKKRLAALIEIAQPDSNSEEKISILKFECPARGLIGFRSALTNMTAGTATLSHLFMEYRPFMGQMNDIQHGSLISMNEGKATAYAISGLEARGAMFIKPQTYVYAGMIVGEHFRPDQDLDVNVVKGKHLTNIRAAAKDENIRLTAPRVITLEYALSYVQNDEMIEITPNNIRLRKRELQMGLRRRDKKQGRSYYTVEGEENEEEGA